MSTFTLTAPTHAGVENLIVLGSVLFLRPFVSHEITAQGRPSISCHEASAAMNARRSAAPRE